MECLEDYIVTALASLPQALLESLLFCCLYLFWSDLVRFLMKGTRGCVWHLFLDLCLGIILGGGSEDSLWCQVLNLHQPNARIVHYLLYYLLIGLYYYIFPYV